MSNFLALSPQEELTLYILTGLALAAGVVFTLLALVAGLAALCTSPVWAVAFVLCGLLAGAGFGVAAFFAEQLW